MTLSPEILVYQMGKVGSKSVYETLSNSGKIDHLVYHMHHLSSAGLSEWIKEYGQAVAEDATFFLTLKKRIDEHLFFIPWKIITLVREPVSWHLSAFFENLKAHFPDLQDQSGGYKLGALLDTFYECHFAACDYYENWFDRELKSVFGIDVFQYPFDPSKGYRIIKEHNIEVLILRLEDLSDCFERAMKEFLDVDDIQLTIANESEHRAYNETYSFMKSNYRLDDKSSEGFYSSRIVRHFYSREEVAKFKRMWGRDSNGPSSSEFSKTSLQEL